MVKIGVLGSSRLGLPALQTLLHNGVPVSLVMPSKASEQTDQLEHMARSYGLVPLKVENQNLKHQLTDWLSREKPELVVVLTFPYIIPSEILDKGGVPWFNFHYAPLPEYRGAEPTFWQLRNQEKEGAVTVHQLTENLDAGPIVFSDPVAIAPDDTHGMYITKLAYSGAASLVKLINLWEERGAEIPLQPQDEAKAKTYPRATARDLIIQWDEMKARDIKALVNAANPWNKGAIAFLEGKPLRISAVSIEEGTPSGNRKAGRLEVDADGSLRINTHENLDLVVDVLAVEEGIYTGKDFARYYQPDNKILSANF